MKKILPISQNHGINKPSRQEAEEAVRTLIKWSGDNPEREGLLDTPRRVVKSYEEFFAGYEIDPKTLLATTFSETEGYDEMVVLNNINIHSYCEHHMLPIIGKAHIAYIPNKRVVGISKLARVAEAYAKRMQIQEKLTAQIAQTINEILEPKGVAVVIKASHQCMSLRGIKKDGSIMQTSQMMGLFRSRPETRQEFLNLIS